MVRELYPQLSEDARSGLIKTAWHPVHIQQGTNNNATDNNLPVSTMPGSQVGNELTGPQTNQELYFVRFDVHVIGGRPWRVHVHGQAALWRAGEIPTPLHGADVPQWLKGRVDSLNVAIYRRLKKYAVAIKYRKKAPARAASPTDLAKFGPVPAAAARVIAEVDRAAVARDAGGLRQFMADQFTYSLGDAPSADTAIAVWQADGTILAALGKVLAAGCAQDPRKYITGPRVVCPARYLQDSSYAGYRAGFQQVGGAWKMVFFVSGE